MEFEIQGVSDNLLILKKEADGVIYEGILPYHVNVMWGGCSYNFRFFDNLTILRFRFCAGLSYLCCKPPVKN